MARRLGLVLLCGAGLLPRPLAYPFTSFSTCRSLPRNMRHFQRYASKSSSSSQSKEDLSTPATRTEPSKSRKKQKKPRGSSSPKTEPEAAKKKQRKRKRKKRSSDEPTHWRNQTDAVVFEEGRLIRFTVRGNPLPLRRHRTSRGFVYNPSAHAQEAFRNVVLEVLQTVESLEPLFGPQTCLVATLLFRLKRPKKDFVGSKPGSGRLRPFTSDDKLVAPSTLSPPPRTDVDNLAKFVLDSLNGVLYEDDKQIVSLHATKCRDNEDECFGSTEVCLRVIHEEDLDALVEQSFDLY